MGLRRSSHSPLIEELLKTNQNTNVSTGYSADLIYRVSSVLII